MGFDDFPDDLSGGGRCREQHSHDRSRDHVLRDNVRSAHRRTGVEYEPLQFPGKQGSIRQGQICPISKESSFLGTIVNTSASNRPVCRLETLTAKPLSER